MKLFSMWKQFSARISTEEKTRRWPGKERKSSGSLEEIGLKATVEGASVRCEVSVLEDCRKG